MNEMAHYPSSLLSEDLPGSDLIAAGLSDLGNGKATAAALATSMAAPRLRALGLDVPLAGSTEASHALYDLLASDDPRSAHSRYNAITRRIASFAHAAERVRTS